MFETTPTTPAPRKRSKKFWIAAGCVGSFMAGAIMASSAGATPEPEVRTETKEVEVVKEVPVEKEVFVDRTPQECVEALDLAAEAIGYADQGFQIGAKFIELIPEAYAAGLSYDDAAADKIISDMEGYNAELVEVKSDIDAVADPMASAAETCRAGAGADS